MGYNEEINAMEGLTQEQKNTLITAHDTDVTGLKNKNSELLGSNKNYKTQLSTFEGVDVEAFNKMKADTDANEQKTMLEEKRYTELLAKHELTNKELQDKITGFKTEKKSNILTNELVKLGVIPESLEIVKSFFNGKAELTNDEVLIDGLSISDSLNAWKDTEQGQMFILAKQNNGAGSTGTPGNNDVGGSISANDSFSKKQAFIEKFGHEAYEQKLKI